MLGNHAGRKWLSGSTFQGVAIWRFARFRLTFRRSLGTKGAPHPGAVSREHLDYYLDEFTFRFNRRTSRHRGKLFYRLLEQAVAVDPVPYAAMVKGVRGLRRRRHPNRS